MHCCTVTMKAKYNKAKQMNIKARWFLETMYSSVGRRDCKGTGSICKLGSIILTRGILPLTGRYLIGTYALVQPPVDGDGDGDGDGWCSLGGYALNTQLVLFRI